MRRYLIFLTAGASLLMYAIDSTVVAVAFPEFTRELNTNLLWSAWTISIFLIAVTMVMPLAGNLSENFGRKKVFLGSLLLFTSSSMFCGLAPNISTLITFRFLQGIGGACFLPVASGIVSESFPESRETAIGLFSSIYNIGAIIGPNLGGWIVSTYSWRYIFYINVPVGVVLIISFLVLVKDAKPFSRQRLDVTGALLLVGTLLFLMLVLNIIGESVSVVSIILCTILTASSIRLGTLFVHREKRTPSPLIDLILLKSKPFVAANISNLILGVVIFGVLSFIPFYSTSVYGLSTLMSGVILTPRSVGTGVVAILVSFLLKKWGYRQPMIWGFIIMAISVMLLAPDVPFWRWADMRWGPVPVLSFLLLIIGIGGGFAFPSSNNACIELMPDRVDTIVGLRTMFRNIGGALGTSVITFILHVNQNRTDGFTIIFFSFGVLLLLSIPLIFFMPSGRGPFRMGGSINSSTKKS